MATRKFALALVLAASAGVLLAGCAGVVPGSPAPPADVSSTQVKPQAVRTVTAAPPVTVTVAAKPPVTATQAPTVTVTPPVTVTQQGRPIIIAPQPDPTTVYQYSPAYTSIYGLPAGLLCRDLNTMGYDYSDAIDYWNYHGHPAMMDIDHNGIPCETVY